jgi:hypothetical protein
MKKLEILWCFAVFGKYQFAKHPIQKRISSENYFPPLVRKMQEPDSTPP